jgi:hypothetical protein
MRFSDFQKSVDFLKENLLDFSGYFWISPGFYFKLNRFLIWVDFPNSSRFLGNSFFGKVYRIFGVKWPLVTSICLKFL